jgi:hypothetical protein
LNGFSSRYEYEQNAKIVCFFVTQNSFLLVVFVPPSDLAGARAGGVPE